MGDLTKNRCTLLGVRCWPRCRAPRAERSAAASAQSPDSCCPQAGCWAQRCLLRSLPHGLLCAGTSAWSRSQPARPTFGGGPAHPTMRWTSSECVFEVLCPLCSLYGCWFEATHCKQTCGESAAAATAAVAATAAADVLQPAGACCARHAAHMRQLPSCGSMGVLLTGLRPSPWHVTPSLGFLPSWPPQSTPTQRIVSFFLSHPIPGCPSLPRSTFILNREARRAGPAASCLLHRPLPAACYTCAACCPRSCMPAGTGCCRRRMHSQRALCLFLRLALPKRPACSCLGPCTGPRPGQARLFVMQYCFHSATPLRFSNTASLLPRSARLTT